jgi:hypothetical protein
MGSYTNIFGGYVVQPAYVGYRNIALNVADLVLSWPSSFLDTPDVTAAFMDVTSNIDGNAIQIPPATQVSVGQPVIFRNIGNNSFLVKDATGTQIFNILPSQIWYIYLIDNTTDAGVWSGFLYGAGASGQDANALAGFGLIPLDGKLNTQLPCSTKNTAYTVTPADRATFFIYTGGTATFTLPAIASVTNGYFFSVNNSSAAGVLTFVSPDGGVLIDSNTTFALSPGETVSFGTNGANWYSLGYGRINTAIIQLFRKDLTGLASYTIQPYEAIQQIQQFFGVLTSNVTITYPSGPKYVYYITNQTSGLFNLFLTVAGSATTIEIVPGTSIIIYSDGNDLVETPSTVAGTTPFLNGSAVTPSVRFVGDETTGLYLAGAGNLGITAAGVQAVDISQDGLDSLVPINSANGGYDEFAVNIYSLMRAYINAG